MEIMFPRGVPCLEFPLRSTRNLSLKLCSHSKVKPCAGEFRYIRWFLSCFSTSRQAFCTFWHEVHICEFFYFCCTSYLKFPSRFRAVNLIQRENHINWNLFLYQIYSVKLHLLYKFWRIIIIKYWPRETEYFSLSKKEQTIKNANIRQL